jgi:hypothetical protein
VKIRAITNEILASRREKRKTRRYDITKVNSIIFGLSPPIIASRTMLLSSSPVGGIPFMTSFPS